MGSTRDLTVCAKESRALLSCVGEIQGPPPGLSLPRLQSRGSTNELLGWAHYRNTRMGGRKVPEEVLVSLPHMMIRLVIHLHKL